MRCACSGVTRGGRPWHRGLPKLQAASLASELTYSLTHVLTYSLTKLPAYLLVAAARVGREVRRRTHGHALLLAWLRLGLGLGFGCSGSG